MKSSIYKIVIPAIFFFCPVKESEAQGIKLTEGVYMVIRGNPSIVLNNAGFINNGNFVSDSENIVIAGDREHASSFISGNRAMSIYNISINTNPGSVDLQNDLFVNGNISLLNGILQLNNNTLDLGRTGAIVGENENAFITGQERGKIRITAYLNAPRSVNPGNIGLALTSNKNLGLTLITRTHLQQTASDGEKTVRRNFDILPEFNSALDATIQFYYLDRELDGQEKKSLTIYSRPLNSNDKLSPQISGNSSGQDWLSVSKLSALTSYSLAVPRIRISSNLSGMESPQLFPNPTGGSFSIIFYSDGEKYQDLYLCDQLGRVLEAKTVRCIQGQNKFIWNAERFPSGTYNIFFRNSNLSAMSFIKQ